MKDEVFMKEALKQAIKAAKLDEVPVGAVVVKDKKVIASAFNKRESTQNAVFHAELKAIEKACKKLGGWRLSDCELFVTLEPCMMCLGACLNARIDRVVFGADNENQDSSALKLFVDKNNHNHCLKISGGVMKEDCAELLKDFFKRKRQS